MPLAPSPACTSPLKGGTSLLCWLKEGSVAPSPRQVCSAASSACCQQAGRDKPTHASRSHQLILTCWRAISPLQTPPEAWGSLKVFKGSAQGVLQSVRVFGGNSALQHLTLCFLTYKRCNLQKIPSFFCAIIPRFWTDYARANNFQAGLSFPRISDERQRTSALSQDA